MSRPITTTIFVLLVLIFGMLCFFTGYYISTEQNTNSVHLVNAKIKRTIPILTISSRTGEAKVRDLTIEVGVGEGRALVNINDMLASHDWQKSARYAMSAAGNYLNEDLSYTDVIFNLEDYRGQISGGSAGAAMTAALLATLNNDDLNSNVLITGTISKEGKIGEVASVLEKAKAAKQHGATLFLVPPGQAHKDVVAEEVCHIEGTLEVCDTEYIEKEVDVSKEAGIAIIEVNNIEQAMNYLLD